MRFFIFFLTLMISQPSLSHTNEVRLNKEDLKILKQIQIEKASKVQLDQLFESKSKKSKGFYKVEFICEKIRKTKISKCEATNLKIEVNTSQ